MDSMARHDRSQATVAGGIRRGAQASRVHGMDEVLLEALEVLEMLGSVFMRDVGASKPGSCHSPAFVRNSESLCER
jgi:hypothetical protein